MFPAMDFSYISFAVLTYNSLSICLSVFPLYPFNLCLLSVSPSLFSSSSSSPSLFYLLLISFFLLLTSTRCLSSSVFYFLRISLFLISSLLSVSLLSFTPLFLSRTSSSSHFPPSYIPFSPVTLPHATALSHSFLPWDTTADVFPGRPTRSFCRALNHSEVHSSLSYHLVGLGEEGEVKWEPTILNYASMLFCSRLLVARRSCCTPTFIHH